MSINDLATLSGPELKKLTDTQLDEILRPYYPLTRPEYKKPRADGGGGGYKQQTLLSTLTPAKREALKDLEESGIDLSFMNRRIKRK